ncbi:MAG: hypothetical protein U0869_05725 [Chloroflexota bacterium]
MPGSNDPSRIYRDPRLTDRRGDATGPWALVFLGIIALAFAGVALLLISLPPVVADPTPRPSVLRTPAPTPETTPTPEPTVEPSLAPERTRQPDATDEPLPSEAATNPPDVPDAQQGIFGEEIPIIINDTKVGTVRLDTFKPGTIPGYAVPDGSKLLVLTVTYTAIESMSYRASDWLIEDPDGNRYPSLGDQAPDPALGSGRLSPGETVTGKVAFVRPPDVAELAWLVLQDRQGNDLVNVDRLTAP